MWRASVPTRQAPTSPASPLARRVWPLPVLLAALAAAYAAGLHRYASPEYLGRQQAILQEAVAAHPVLAVGGYLLLYAGAVLLLFPGTPALSMVGGLLFGVVPGAIAAVAGATSGALCLFLVARRAFGAWLAGWRGGALVERMRPGLERDGFLCLLAARLLPMFPFWLVNLAAAAAGMRAGTFAVGTALGIIPTVLVYASAGAGLGAVLAEGGQPSLSGILLRPGVLGPLAGLALLSLLPVLWRRRKRAGARS